MPRAPTSSDSPSMPPAMSAASARAHQCCQRSFFGRFRGIWSQNAAGKAPLSANPCLTGRRTGMPAPDWGPRRPPHAPRTAPPPKHSATGSAPQLPALLLCSSIPGARGLAPAFTPTFRSPLAVSCSRPTPSAAPQGRLEIVARSPHLAFKQTQRLREVWRAAGSWQIALDPASRY